VNNVVKFPPPLSDVAGHLRELANRLDAGEHGDPVAFVGILETGDEFMPMIFGACDDIRAIGLVAVLQTLMADMTLEE
jgi:hypothetical protein